MIVSTASIWQKKNGNSLISASRHQRSKRSVSGVTPPFRGRERSPPVDLGANQLNKGVLGMGVVGVEVELRLCPRPARPSHRNDVSGIAPPRRFLARRLAARVENPVLGRFDVRAVEYRVCQKTGHSSVSSPYTSVAVGTRDIFRKLCQRREPRKPSAVKQGGSPLAALGGTLSVSELPHNGRCRSAPPYPRFLETKLGRPVIVAQPAGIPDRLGGCRPLSISPSTCPLVHPPAAPAENPYTHPRSRKASRSTPGGAYQPSAPYLAPRPNASSLFPYGIRSGVGDPSFDCGPPADAPVLSC